MSDYAGKIKVVCVDLLCFPVDPVTLEATRCGCYDAYASTHPEPDAIETISHSEWITRRYENRCQAKYTPATKGAATIRRELLK